ncbi:hypothetical protein PGT21_001783 [Puccinia graminis f. sp. tritici]|uniref:Hydrophobin n=1 Tax=Puccinia graminis f. sp. tritici TaxID=56615 RepID=A0A5B0SHM3_PUCGR|nr:hypothetical protein PGTUg99_009097 [Puccinia graminis f. sp. tritici]KAA1071267.1 hypothetical protein PGT21_001783 [Puccinia graminis f. sp. tritici]KAA1137468.1 hypothetical protein PGTUg99_017763 [Puccinia graminis f. sp. tritici]
MHFITPLSSTAVILVLIMSLSSDVSGAFCPSASKSNRVCGATDPETGKISQAQLATVTSKEKCVPFTFFTCKVAPFDTPICCSNPPDPSIKSYNFDDCSGAPVGVTTAKKRGEKPPCL